MEYLLFLPLFGPGLALVFWLMADQEFTLFDRLILGLGISLAFYPIFLLLFHIAGLPVNAPVIGTLVAVSWLGLLWQLVPHLRKFSTAVRQPLALKLEATTLTWLFLAIVLALSAYVRIAVVKDLKIPMWADSYHHTMISQLMIDNNGLFNSWLPYAPLKTFTYHFGFHSLVAGYHWLTGVAMPRSVIVTGQIINMVVVLGCYLLAKYLTGKEWAGIVAALFVGLISPMPAYYFNWGRYPQLTGLALLPPGIVMTLVLFNRPGFDWRMLFVTSITIAGLGLTHYGVLAFFVLFGGPFLLYELIAATNNGTRGEIIGKAAAVGLIAGLIMAPWIWNFFSGRFFFIITRTIEQGASAPAVQEHNSLGNITVFLNAHWYLATVLAALWALWRRDKWVILTVIWVVLLLVLANPHHLRLPGTGLINNFAVFISLFLPFSVLLGNLTADLIERSQIWQPWGLVIVLLVLLTLGLRGATFRLNSIEANRQLVADQDLAAMAWIKKNIPADAKFVVESYLGYGNTTVLGSDAGWWLPLLTGRQTTLPPMIYGKETANEANYYHQIRLFQQQTEPHQLLTREGWQILQEAGISHIYIGQQAGRMSYDGDEVLDAQTLSAVPYYRLIYHQDRVAIFAVKPGIP